MAAFSTSRRSMSRSLYSLKSTSSTGGLAAVTSIAAANSDTNRSPLKRIGTSVVRNRRDRSFRESWRSSLHNFFFSAWASKLDCLSECAIFASSAKASQILFCKRGNFKAWPLNSCKGFASEPQTVPSSEQEVLDFPGVRVRYTTDLEFIHEAASTSIPCYRLLDDNGQLIKASYVPEVDQALGLKIYKNMVTLQVMDTIFYEAQRQGRFSFYMTTTGEEAINVASPAALSHNDMVFPQYREPGVLLWRGFTLQQFANQCWGNGADNGKGRQMPIHYVSRELNYLTVSSPIATQLPQAVGAAYSLKMDKQPFCSVTYFGDGGSSEGDFHAAMNFASVFEVPVLFMCRNNGWAISTPASEQYKSDGLVIKGQSYGMCSVRVDGNDALAVYSATRAARKMAAEQCKPVFIELLTYRSGHHSTSDDSSKYRSAEEIEHWKLRRDPVLRLRKWIEDNGWWNIEEEHNLRADVRAQVLSAVQNAESMKKPPLSDLFTDVYDSPPENLKMQERVTRDFVQRYPKDYPSDVPI
eukprot:c24971_g1_i1 orf=153-1730(+)